MTARDEQRRQLEAALAALDDDDDGSDEIEYEYDGKRVRGQYRRVGPMMEALGFKLRPDQIEAAEPDAEGDDKPKKQRFGGGKPTTIAGRRIS
jgi:hypothetical protein